MHYSMYTCIPIDLQSIYEILSYIMPYLETESDEQREASCL